MLLSVIIPIYNTEAYIDRCVESVASQSYTALQIILVDDGSTDGSSVLCEKWKKKDPRIEVIHKANGGLSDARNAGIEKARGDLITFVDADDFIRADTYEEVVADMTSDTDIMEYPVFRFYGSPRQEILSFTPQVYESPYDYWTRGKAYDHAYAWNKIFKHTIFNEARFPVGKVFEDVFIMTQMMTNTRTQKRWKIMTTTKGLYYYCANPNGITAQATGEQCHTLLTVHLNNPWLMSDDTYYLHVLNIQITVFAQTQYPVELPSKKIRHIAQLKGRQQAKALLVNLLGTKILCKLYKTLQRTHLLRW